MLEWLPVSLSFCLGVCFRLPAIRGVRAVSAGIAIVLIASASFVASGEFNLGGSYFFLDLLQASLGFAAGIGASQSVRRISDLWESHKRPQSAPHNAAASSVKGDPMSKLHKICKEILAVLAYILQFTMGKRRAPVKHCVCPPALKKPDPFLYSQQYLISLGLPVTWDNPDIFVYQGNTLVDPHSLHANTTYTVVARIWNNSPDVPVINLKVNFSYLSFGMGTQSNPIDVTAVDLAAKGLPGCPAFAYMAWTTPPTLGHYCLQVLLEPPDDSNWLNNLGQRNTDVTQPQSPALFTFAVGNHVAPRTRNVRFKVDCYTVPATTGLF